MRLDATVAMRFLSKMSKL